MDVSKAIIYRQIGAKVAYYRTLRGMTQAQLAVRVNINKSVISRIERGRYNKSVSLSMLIDIAKGLRIDLSLLVSFSEMEKKIWWEQEIDIDDDTEENLDGDTKKQVKNDKSILLQEG